MSWHGLCVCFLPCLLLELGVLLREAAVLVKTIHKVLEESYKEYDVGSYVIKQGFHCVQFLMLVLANRQAESLHFAGYLCCEGTVQDYWDT